MSGRGGSLGLKRKRAGSDGPMKCHLMPDERPVYDLIKRMGNMGIWKGDVRKELNIPNVRLVDNCIKSLMAKKLIKEVPNIQAKGKKRLMASEFEPSEELTGGEWYQDGTLDNDLIDTLKRLCKDVLYRKKVATAAGILSSINNSKVLNNFELTVEQLKQILDNLCLEKEIMKVKSNGLGEFISFPINAECYKLKPKLRNVGALASIPCGVCPRINQCCPDGIISPVTCVYYTKWLEF